MSSPFIPRTPTRGPSSSRPYSGSGLDVSFLTCLSLVERQERRSQFIKYGNFVLLFSVATQLPFIFTKLDVAKYICDSQLVINTHLYCNVDYEHQAGHVLHVSGSLGPWAFRTVPKDDPDVENCWHTLLTSSLSAIQRIHNVTIQDPDLVPLQAGWIDCSFMGRVCSPPQTQYIRLDLNALKPMLHHGFFVELQFFLNRNEEGPPSDLLKRGSYAFYIFVFFDDSALRRHGWAVKEGSKKLKEDQHIYCSGRIMGQLQQDLIFRAGYEADTPVDRSPVLVVIPGESIRPAGDAPSSSYSETSSPEKTSVRTGLQARMMQAMKKKPATQVEVEAEQSTSAPSAESKIEAEKGAGPDVQLVHEQALANDTKPMMDEHSVTARSETEEHDAENLVEGSQAEEGEDDSDNSMADFIDDSEGTPATPSKKRKGNNDENTPSQRLRSRR